MADDPSFEGTDAVDDDVDNGGARSGRASEEADRAAGMWHDLLELDARLHEQMGVRLLTPEGRVLMHLKLNGPLSMSAAIQVAGTSYRGFYAVLERLRQAGIVATVKDERDQRVRRLSLNPSVPLP